MFCLPKTAWPPTSQLQDASYLAAHTVNTGEGTLTVTGYSSADDKSAEVGS